MTIGHPAVGTDVAGYRIEHLLGRGGMGTRVSRVRRAARPAGRAEAAHSGRVGFRRRARAAAARVAARGTARPPERHPHLRSRATGRPAVHRDALRRRRRPQGAPASRGRAAAGAGRRARGAGRRRARRRAPPRPRASRREAEQRAARLRGRPRALLSGRLRADPEHHRPRAGRRAGHGHDRLRRARADPRRPARRAGRPVRARVPAVRVPDRIGAVPRTLRRRGDLRPPRGAGPARVRARRRPARRDRSRARPRHGQAPGGALRELLGARGGGKHGARPWPRPPALRAGDSPRSSWRRWSWPSSPPCSCSGATPRHRRRRRAR